MPYTELLSSAILIGVPSMNAVASSSLVIWNEPSPSMSHTGFLPSKYCCEPISAPIAAGRPKPIVPRPPDEIHWCGWWNSMSCVAHIWCWPTPETQIVFGSASAESCCTTHCGASVPSVGSSYATGYCSTHLSSNFHHVVRSGLPYSLCSCSICGINACSTVFTSPTIGTSATRFLPISAGSMSMWITRAPGAKASSLPVTRSSKRAPIATSRSERCTAPVAAIVPCMPSMPSTAGSSSGTMPRAGSVVTIGAPVRSLSALISLPASERTAPPPTYSTGRNERWNMRAASASTWPCASVTGL